MDVRLPSHVRSSLLHSGKVGNGSLSTMDRLTHSSLYVAPLQISKDTSRTTSSMSERPQTASSTADSTRGIQQPGQMTPPLTPHDSEASFDMHHEFHTYLRAFYPYHPAYDDNSSTVTLPLNSGDVILVHSVHTNGWADGTLLSSGARGWLPTNYCEGYGNEPIRNLMKALTVFWDLVKGSNIGGLVVFRNSDYVRGLVAGVRCLLVCHPHNRSWIEFAKGCNWLMKLLGRYKLPQPRVKPRSVSPHASQATKSASVRSLGLCQNHQRSRKPHGKFFWELRRGA